MDYVSRCVVAPTNGDGSTFEEDKCNDILDEALPSFLTDIGDATTKLNGSDIEVTGTASTEAIADAVINRSTDAISIAKGNGDAVVTITFKNAAVGLQVKTTTEG